MNKALYAVRSGEMGFNQAVRSFKIPRATLKRRLDGTNKYAKNELKYNGRPQVLSEQIETLLVRHILDLDSMMFGVSRNDLRSLAFQLAAKNGLAHAFNTTKLMAGSHWYYLFIKRHPQLSLRQPEATSIARARGFNRKSVSDFFNLLEGVIEKYSLSGTRIFNMDESGLTSVQKPGKVISLKGKKQVGGITSGERGQTTTIVCCMSGAGQYIPPMMIFRRMRMTAGICDGAPEGCLITNNKSGWMDSDLFQQWVVHFQANVNATKDNPALLLLDGHSSHTKNLEAIDFARENSIIMLALPPHTTHRLQPLDRAFFKPLMGNYNIACDQWMRNHAGRQITIYQISKLFSEAYIKSATMSNAISGFTTTGIWPCNRSVFTDSDFVAADRMTDDQESSPANDHRAADTATSLVPPGPRAATSLVPPGPRAADTATSLVPPGPRAADTATSLVLPGPRAATSLVPPGPRAADTATSLVLPGPRAATSLVPPGPRAAETAMSLVLPGPRAADTDSTHHSVIRTNADGRCFFRSLAIGVNKNLQLCKRDAHGLPTDVMLKVYEVAQSDSIRSAMIQEMCCNFKEYENLDHTSINADLPPHVRYNSIEDRITSMANATEMVGEIEIIAVTKALQQGVNVHMAGGSVITYGDQFKTKPPLSVLFSTLAEDVGHYDYLQPQPEIPTLITPQMISPLPKAFRKKTGHRTTQSTILTYSPYKNSLSAKDNRKRQGNIPYNCDINIK